MKLHPQETAHPVADLVQNSSYFLPVTLCLSDPMYSGAKRLHMPSDQVGQALRAKVLPEKIPSDPRDKYVVRVLWCARDCIATCWCFMAFHGVDLG